MFSGLTEGSSVERAEEPLDAPTFEIEGFEMDAIGLSNECDWGIGKEGEKVEGYASCSNPRGGRCILDEGVGVGPVDM